MEKMNGKDQAAVRKQLYELTTAALEGSGFNTETIATGILIDLGNGYFAKGSFSVCDATKFDIDVTRAQYQEKLDRAAEVAEKRAESARKKAEKAAAAEAKKAEKAAKETKE